MEWMSASRLETAQYEQNRVVVVWTEKRPPLSRHSGQFYNSVSTPVLPVTMCNHLYRHYS